MVDSCPYALCICLACLWVLTQLWLLPLTIAITIAITITTTMTIAIADGPPQFGAVSSAASEKARTSFSVAAQSLRA